MNKLPTGFYPFATIGRKRRPRQQDPKTYRVRNHKPGHEEKAVAKRERKARKRTWDETNRVAGQAKAFARGQQLAFHHVTQAPWGLP